MVGLNALKVAGNFVYAANGYGANFSTCRQGQNCAQLQIIDVTDPAAPKVAYSYKLPGIVGSGGQGAGNSIFYSAGFVYLGLSKVGPGSVGGEFNIIDVRNFPDQPPVLAASYPVGAGAKSIYVKGHYAYLATDDNDTEMLVLDISNTQTTPLLAGKFNASGTNNFGYGASIYPIGGAVYFGRTYVNNGPEFYILDASALDPATNTPVFGLNDIGPSSSKPFSVNGVIVRNHLAFLLTGSGSKGGGLEVFNVSNPQILNQSQPVATVALPPGGSGAGGISEDCEGNYLYAGSVDSAGAGHITIITGQ